jgi:radical SAM protein with 4Fe4S-binding SPASM domain
MIDISQHQQAGHAQSDPTLLSKPFAIFNIELTNRCPFKCVMCARTHQMTREHGDMSFDIFRKVIDELVAVNPSHARDNEVWMHGFGESVTHPRFADFMRYATDRGVNASLSVNPLMLTPKVGRDLLEARPGTLYLSLDGHNDETFERIRGLPNAYEKSKERLHEFIALKREIGSRTRLVLSMINFKLNEESILEASEDWRRVEGLDEVLLKPFTVWDGSVKDVNVFRKNQFIKGEKVTCTFPFEKMTVCWDGTVTPCCYDYDDKYILGRVQNQSLSEIWNGAPMRSLRLEFLNNSVANPLCRICPELYGVDG